MRFWNNRFYVIFCSMFILGMGILQAQSYRFPMKQNFLELGITYERATRDMNVEFRPVNSSLNVSPREDRQEINQDRSLVLFGFNVLPRLQLKLGAGFTNLKGKDYDFGDTVGRVRFDGKNSFYWRVGVEWRMLEQREGFQVISGMDISGYNVKIDRGKVNNVNYNVWIGLAQEFFWEPYPSPGIKDRSFKPYLLVGYSYDDWDADLITSTSQLLVSPGRNKQKLLVRLGGEIRWDFIKVDLRGHLIDERGVQVSFSTFF